MPNLGTGGTFASTCTAEDTPACRLDEWRPAAVQKVAGRFPEKSGL